MAGLFEAPGVEGVPGVEAPGLEFRRPGEPLRPPPDMLPLMGLPFGPAGSGNFIPAGNLPPTPGGTGRTTGGVSCTGGLAGLWGCTGGCVWGGEGLVAGVVTGEGASAGLEFEATKPGALSAGFARAGLTRPGFDEVKAGLPSAGLELMRAGLELTRAGFEPTKAGFEPTKAGLDPTNAGLEPINAGFINAGFPLRAGLLRAGFEPLWTIPTGIFASAGLPKLAGGNKPEPGAP